MSNNSENANGVDLSTLLDVAKGFTDPTQIGLKDTNVSHWNVKFNNSRELIHFRREVRRGIYKIIKYSKRNLQLSEKLQELKDIIEPQLDGNLGLSWNTFAFKWDIHPKEPLKVIIKEHWIKEGGGFDADLGYHYPHAFTKEK